MARNYCTAIFDEADVAAHKEDADGMFSYIIMGKEICPETGNVHWQTYVELKTQTRWTTLYKKFPKTSFKDTKGKYLSRKGQPSQARDYCLKDQNPRDPAYTMNVHEKGECPPDKPKKTGGKKRKLEPYCEEIELRQWQKDLIAKLEQPPSRTLFWIWSNAGHKGKTTFSKWLCKNMGAIALNGKAHDQRHGLCTWIEKNKRWCDVPVVCNIPKSFDKKYLSYEGIENIKDQFFYSGKYEGGQVCGPPIHYIVFANFPPEGDEMSADRYDVVNIDDDDHMVEEDGVTVTYRRIYDPTSGTYSTVDAI